MGRQLGDRRRPAARLRALGREVLDARDDGDRPQHRAERRQRPRPGRGQRQRALRLGLLPPADPDVRQDRARRRGRRSSQRRWTRPRRPRGSSSTPTSSAADLRRAGRHVQGDRPRARRARLPAGPARAARPGDRRRLRLVEHRARAPLPPPGAHPARPGHRGQRLHHGVRQPRRRLRHRRLLHPRPGHRPAGRLRRLPAERPGRGRRRRASATPLPLEELEALDNDSYDELLQHHAQAREALPRPVRHRVHHRARQAVDAADPRRQAHRGRGLPDRRRSSSTRA